MSSAEQAVVPPHTGENTWPAHVGHYRLIAPIGGGSSGTVFRSIDERSGGVRALKLVSAVNRGQNAALGREFALLFQLRTKGLPGVVQALETGRAEGRAWYSMEFVEGLDLRELLHQLWQSVQREPEFETHEMPGDPQPPSIAPTSAVHARLPTPFASRESAQGEAGAGRIGAVLDLARELATTLAHLHASGVVHADISPRNVIVAPDGSVKLLDFGSAFYAAMGQAREVAQAELGVRGTPGYMAPEQIRGLPVDGRADLYAFGCLLYELVTGKAPFSADDTRALASQHLSLAVIPPSARTRGVPSELEQLILALLQKERHLRFPYAGDVVRTLDAISGRSNAGSERDGGVPTPLYRARMVGRRATMDSLQERLLRASTSTSTTPALLLGEAGAGKTRLLNELATGAQFSGIEVIAARCLENRNTSGTQVARAPFEPLSGVLERLADPVVQGGDGALGLGLASDLAVLAPYSPTLAGLVPASFELPILPPELARARAVRAMARALSLLAKPRPLLLVLDDLHWADDLTIDFVHGVLAGTIGTGRATIVGSARPEALDVRLSSTLESRPDLRLELERLTLDDVRSMSKEMLATNLLPEGLGEFVFRHSEGNALLTAEYVEILATRGDLRRIGPQLWAFAEPVKATVPLPKSLQEFLSLKREGLSDAGRHLLERASVHSAGFELDLLEVDAGPHETALLVPLHELASVGLIEALAPDRYRFAQEELRQAIEQGLPRDECRRLHAQAVRCLLERESSVDSPGVDDARLAHHYARLGEHSQAMLRLERAGERAARGHAYSLAGELLRAAVAQGELALEPGSHEAGRNLLRLREALADMLLRCARHEEARRNYDQIALGNEGDSLMRARALRKKAKSFWLVHDYDRAIGALDAAARELGELDRLSSQDELQEWIEASQGRFWIYYFGRQIGEQSAALVAQMGPVVERAGTTAQKAMFHQCAAGELMARHQYLYSEQAVQHARRAVEFSDPVRYPAEAADAQFALGFALIQGDSAACQEAAELLSRVALSLDSAGDATVLARLLTYQAVAHRRLHQVEAVERTSNLAFTAAEAARLPTYMAAATACLAWVAWMQGDVSTTERKAREAELIWSRERHAFPFRRLSGFVLLAIRHAAEDVAGSQEIIAALLAPGQQRFPAELAEALNEAQVSALSSDGKRASAALLRALEVVRRLGFD